VLSPHPQPLFSEERGEKHFYSYPHLFVERSEIPPAGSYLRRQVSRRRIKIVLNFVHP